MRLKSERTGNYRQLTAEGVRGQFAPKGYPLMGTPLMGAELRRVFYGLRGAGRTNGGAPCGGFGSDPIILSSRKEGCREPPAGGLGCPHSPLYFHLVIVNGPHSPIKPCPCSEALLP